MTALVALVLAFVCIPLCLLVCSRGVPLARLVGLEVLGIVCTALALLFADLQGRSTYVDVALVLALLSFLGSLVFARFLGRSL